MKASFIDNLFGYVTFELWGDEPEDFINAAISEGIELWGLKGYSHLLRKNLANKTSTNPREKIQSCLYRKNRKGSRAHGKKIQIQIRNIGRDSDYLRFYIHNVTVLMENRNCGLRRY